jgi:hypothetical protein
VDSGPGREPGTPAKGLREVACAFAGGRRRLRTSSEIWQRKLAPRKANRRAKCDSRVAFIGAAA